MRISDWSSDVCSSDLPEIDAIVLDEHVEFLETAFVEQHVEPLTRGQLALGVLRRDPLRATTGARQIGRASSRDRVCQYVLFSVVAGSFNKKNANSKPSHV